MFETACPGEDAGDGIRARGFTLGGNEKVNRACLDWRAVVTF